MAALNGFVKLHRKMIEWGWYSDCVVKDVFLHLLMVASWKDSEYLGHKLNAGDAIIGRKKLAQELGFTEQQIRTALKKLESTGEIKLKSTNRFTIASIENWEFYQCDDETINQQITNNQPTDNQQITNNQPHLKKVKKVNKVKKVKNIYGNASKFHSDSRLDNAINDFVEFRKKIKKPMTERAVQLMINKLNKLSTDVNVQVEILNQSIMNGWQGIFPLKEQEQKKSISVYGENGVELDESKNDLDDLF